MASEGVLATHRVIVAEGLEDDYQSIWSDAYPDEPAPAIG